MSARVRNESTTLETARSNRKATWGFAILVKVTCVQELEFRLGVENDFHGESQLQTVRRESVVRALRAFPATKKGKRAAYLTFFNGLLITVL